MSRISKKWLMKKYLQLIAKYYIFNKSHDAAGLQKRRQGKKKAKKSKKYLQKAKEAGNIFKCRQATSESLRKRAAKEFKKVLDRNLRV